MTSNEKTPPADEGRLDVGVRPLSDSERLDFLQWLTTRTEFQNIRRPTESVYSDMHIGGGRCSLYVRNIFGNPIQCGMRTGHDVRQLVDEVAHGLWPNGKVSR